MESYFKAAVSDLDKLLDEFEQCTDEYDCYRTPQNLCDSKHHSLSSVLGHSQHVYPAPKLQEDVNSCNSSEEISLASHIETSEVLLSDSEQYENSVAGPDLLSTVDSSSLNEIQVSNLSRCSIPVCDLVNDTGNVIHSGPAHEDTQELQPGDFQYSEGLTDFGMLFPTCASSDDCSDVSNTKRSEGDSVAQDGGHPKADKVNNSDLKSDSYMTVTMSDPCNDQLSTELVECSEIFDQVKQTYLNAVSVLGTSQNCNMYSPKDGKAYEVLPCVPQDENACSVANKEMYGRNVVEKMNPEEESDVESLPSDLPKRPQLHKCNAVLPENSVLPESTCQTGAKVEVEEKITEDNADDEELNGNEILSTVLTSCILAEDVQISLSDLPVSVRSSLVVTEDKANSLPQNEVVEVISNSLMESHTRKSNTDLSGMESFEKTGLNEQDGSVAKICASAVEKSTDGDNHNNENVNYINSQENKALPSAFLEYEVDPYGVDIDSYSDSISPDMTDFSIKEFAVSDAELDDFLYRQSLQSNVLKSSDNDSNLIEADVDEGLLTSVNILDFIEVAEEHMQAKSEEIVNISSDLKPCPTANESESATEETTSCIQGMTESGSETLMSGVCSEGARPKRLLGLSQGAVGQRQQNKTSVLERENQEDTSATTEAPVSGSSIDVAKNSEPVCSGESSSEVERNQMSENVESFKRPAALSWKQPLWVPDSEAPNCMNCQVKFTFTRRRHHCRACGKVFCGVCCKQKCKLQYMEKEARVCTGCYDDINIAQAFERMMSSTGPDSNSSISSKNSSPTSPLNEIQIPSSTRSTSPSELLPVSALKQPSTEGQNSRKKKRVWFADGILPGGELTDVRQLPPGTRSLSEELCPVNPYLDKVVNPKESNPCTDDLSGQSEMAHSCKSGTLETKEHSTAETEETSSGCSFFSYRALCGVENCVSKEISLVPDSDKLPPLLLAVDEKGRDPVVEDHPSHEQVTMLLQEKDPNPLTFILNANLLVNVKQITYSSELCWYFSTNGLHGLGQAEIIILLQCLPHEEIFPSEIFKLFIAVYKDAMKGKFIRNMENITFTEMFLNNKEHGGLLFVSPTFQKLDDLILPDSPFLCGILIHKLEIPWAKAFPIRLMLRLGAEYRAYPTPIISFRNRQPLFGHTTMNLLVDLKNYQYTWQTIENLLVHVEMGRSCIKIPLRKYNEVIKVIESSKQHVITIGASFNTEADSHLVCIQTEHGDYHTQAISATGNPRKVTGASFVVFKGALEATSGFLAKSSIVEDGLLVQITPETMANLRQALRQKKDFKITCGRMEAGSIKEYVDICWVEGEERTNKRILSPVDGKTMEGTQVEKVWQDKDFKIKGKVLKCTEVYYFLEDNDQNTGFPHQFAKEIAVACSTALCPHLKTLKNNAMNKIGLRVYIDSDMVEYLAGSGGQILPQNYLNELDLTLIPVIHSGMADSSSLPLKMELVFFIIEHLI